MDDFEAEPTLVVLCKRPTLTQGKQRLARTLGGPRTLRLAEAFLQCALEDACQWPGPVVLSPSAASDKEWARGLRPGTRVVEQGAGNLGQRIGELDRRLREAGARRLLYIGTDAPMLTPTHYRSACQALEHQDVVLAAASDGGVVMMGASKPWPDLQRLPWSSPGLGAALRSACGQAGLGVTYIPPGYDIDLEEDLARLREDLAGDERPARQHLRRLIADLDSSRRNTA